jgi:hypothetical protein
MTADRLLLAFPRSGSSWLRYIVEHCTGRAVPDMGKPALAVYHEFGQSAEHVEGRSPIMRKIHAIHEAPPELFSRADVVLLLRDPAEVIASYLMADRGSIEEPKFKEYLGWYENNAECQPDHVVYYESLMLNPGPQIRELLMFLDHPVSAARKFMDRYQFHREKSLHYKSQGGLKLQTNGDGWTQVFRSQLPRNLLADVQAMCRRNELLERYEYGR